MENTKTALVCGAGGFIGSHLVAKLKQEGFWVRGVDIKQPEFSASKADEFLIGDLREAGVCKSILDRPFDEVYQLAADMGGAGYLFTGEHDADVLHNSAQINLNMAHFCQKAGVKKIFYSSSACMYPKYNQEDPENPRCEESSAYPADPDSEYGWEKLFSERLYLSFRRNYGLDVRIARFHNIFGPESPFSGGREKAPAAIARKVAEAQDGGEIEIWGDGQQTRSFLYIDECLEGIKKLMDSTEFHGPVNIGSEEMVTINELAEMFMKVAGKTLSIKHVAGPLGVRGRNSDNRLIKEKLGWSPTQKLEVGVKKIYTWVSDQIKNSPQPKATQLTTNRKTMPEIRPNEVYTSEETQELLKVSNSTLKRLIKKGLLKANKLGGQYRFLGHDLLRMLSPEFDEKATQVYQKIKTSAREKVKDW